MYVEKSFDRLCFDWLHSQRMAEDEKAEIKSPSSLVGDVTKAIRDAWDFFLPATFRLLAAGLVVYFLAGNMVTDTCVAQLKADLLAVNGQTIADILEKYKLTSAIPIAALFFLSVLVYAFNRCVAAIGSF